MSIPYKHTINISPMFIIMKWIFLLTSENISFLTNLSNHTFSGNYQWSMTGYLHKLIKYGLLYIREGDILHGKTLEIKHFLVVKCDMIIQLLVKFLPVGE